MRTPRSRSFVALLAVLMLTLSLGACSSSSGKTTLAKPATTLAPTTEAATTTTSLPVGNSLVAQTVRSVSSVTVYTRPSTSSKVRTTLSNPNENGAPLVFLVVKQQSDGWLRVDLPIRPNGAKGWVQTSQMQVSLNPYRVVVSHSKHRLQVFRDGATKVFDVPVGVGQSQYPTPGGTYYIKELLQPPDPSGPYGPYAYGLSGFTEVAELANFNGGSGVIGIHGTDQPQFVGTDVSHGCIRLYNDDIRKLVKILPLGTPVEIQA